MRSESRLRQIDIANKTGIRFYDEAFVPPRSPPGRGAFAAAFVLAAVPRRLNKSLFYFAARFTYCCAIASYVRQFNG
ncbi:hypothetical protein EVAR_66304_1 [Eumeta japonica]|uniref:Uncharacterized protein n=1 Tax=Eumeta variegata TaxID=151549 RepID=A0A4C1Z6T7_EUMVA|nr:hypothetical protein EVAR_66304_1 [Eumeta japonica]